VSEQHPLQNFCEPRYVYVNLLRDFSILIQRNIYVIIYLPCISPCSTGDLRLHGGKLKMIENWKISVRTRSLHDLRCYLHICLEIKTLKSGWPVSEPKLEPGTSQIRSINPDYSNTAFCDETKQNRNTPQCTFGRTTTLEVRSNI
jgi:hypothetical protein